MWHKYEQIYIMPENFIRCVRKLKKKYPNNEYNPYAVCRKSTGYYGSSHDIGLIHPKRRSK